ncbi:MAG: oligogalacturonate lyase family protein, partial [Kluyvera ascorbata]
YLFEPGKQKTRRIACHGTSWRVIDGQCQASHPHPSFSPDLRHVLYTSDREGLPAVYLADISTLLTGRS